MSSISTSLLKEKLKIKYVPKLARLGHAMGMSWEQLGDVLGREVLIGQAQILNGSPIEQTDQSLDIVFFTMIGGHTYNVSIDAVFGLALRARGHRVRFVVCDQVLPACEIRQATHEAKWNFLCQRCCLFGFEYLQAFDFEVIRLSELLPSDLSSEENRKWGAYVDSAILKHFKVGVLDPELDTSERRRRFGLSAAMSEHAALALVKQRPDRVVMSNGIYCTWGPAFEVFREYDIPVVTYSKGKKKSTEKFNWNVSADQWDISSEWERVRDVALTPEQDRVLDRYLASRRGHSNDELVYNFGQEEDASELRHRLSVEATKPTFVLFTNVLWDASSVDKELVFRDPVEWTFETIRWFWEKDSKQLIIKIHPAEVVIGTRQPFAEIITDEFGVLPDHIKLIEPGDKINSWSIIGLADAGLVHTSTVGMELSVEGVPCAVVSKAHYRGKGFTVDIATKEEYFQFIDEFDRQKYDDRHMITLARRYAYALFERYQIPLEIFYEPAWTDVRSFTFGSIEELREKTSVALFLHSVETLQPFLLPA